MNQCFGGRMDFPIFEEFLPKNANEQELKAFLFDRQVNPAPVFINLNSFSLDKAKFIVQKLENYFVENKINPHIAYPLYLLAPIHFLPHLKWKYKCSKKCELPKYYRRKIFLKNSSQIEELKKNAIYQIGLNENNIQQTVIKMQKFNKIFEELRDERIQQIKFDNILKSFQSNSNQRVNNE